MIPAPEAGERAGLLAQPNEVRAILIASARAGQAITYSEVLGLLGHQFSRPKMRALCAVLAHVDEDSETRGEPELAVLVVRQSDGLPGEGWWVGGAKAHRFEGSWQGPEATALIGKLHCMAFAHWAGRED
ncbi:MAG: ribose-phosphate pyrophosphokinase [Sphingomicrobium sp.]